LNEFDLLVLNSHQFFFAMVACTFCFFLLMDMEDFKLAASMEKRRLIITFLSAVSLGVLGLLLTTWSEKGFFFAISFSVLITCSLISPKYAISFLVYLLLSRPWESFDDQMMASMPRDISILTLLSLASHKLFRRQFYFRFNLGTLLLLAFSFWMFLSGFMSHHADVAVYQFNEIFSKGIILFLLIQNGIEQEDDMLPVKAVFVLSILEKCFVSYYKSNLIELPTIVDSLNERLESVGILSNSNDIAAIFVLALPFTLYFILKTKLRPFNWIIGAAALFLMVLLVWQSQSRGALLGVMAIFGAWTLMRIKSKKILTFTLVLGFIGTLGAFKLMNRDASDVEGSTSNRILYWHAGLNMAIRNPVFGVGFWGFPHNLPAYVPDGNIGSEGEHMTAHSSWVLALGEGGFMALFLFLGLWIYAGFAAWKLRLTDPEYLMGLAGYGMCITFLSHTYLLYPYILLALIITHYQISKPGFLKEATV
jgi:hypothetical protein